MFQSSNIDLSEAIDLTKATIDYIASYDYNAAKDKCAEIVSLCQSKGLFTQDQKVESHEQTALARFNSTIVKNLNSRFDEDAKNSLAARKILSAQNFDLALKADWIKSVVSNVPHPQKVEMSDLLGPR
jgi:hypothetical protein